MKRMHRPSRGHQAPEFHQPLVPCNIPLHRCPVPRESAAKRILIMRVGAFGDILMGTPLLAALRQAYPDAHLTWIVEHSEVQAIDANPYIDEYLRWDGAFWKKMLRRGLYPLWLARALAFQKQLRDRRYDVFVSFQPEEWPLLVRGADAAITVGVFDTFRRYYRATRTSANTRLYTHPYAYPDLPDHRIDQYLLTLKALGLPSKQEFPMSMGFTAEDQESAANVLAGAGVSPSERLVILAPMTTWPTKCWPGERYAMLGDALVRQHGCRIVIIGSRKEQAAIEEIAARMQTPPLLAVGTLSFREMAALIARAALVVSGDTGPMHVAAALQVPQIALFGPTSAKWYGPRGGRALTLAHDVPCGPCDQKYCPNTGEDHMRCMRLLSVPEVLEAAGALLPELTPSLS
jgi:ADP-heptose:LPS heptosyltransferase